MRRYFEESPPNITSLKKLIALHDRLILSGYPPNFISIAGTPNDHKYDNLRLATEYEGWSIRYWERGRSQSLKFKTNDIDAAIAEYERLLGFKNV